MIIRYHHSLKSLAAKLRNSSTRSEIYLWNRLKGKQQGYRFTRQKPIGRYIVDFYCKELKLAIELDGISHQNEKTMDKDRTKEADLNHLGIEVLHFQDQQIMEDIENVMAVIHNTAEYLSGNNPVPPL